MLNLNSSRLSVNCQFSHSGKYKFRMKFLNITKRVSECFNILVNTDFLKKSAVNDIDHRPT